MSGRRVTRFGVRRMNVSPEADEWVGGQMPWLQGKAASAISWVRVSGAPNACSRTIIIRVMEKQETWA